MSKFGIAVIAVVLVTALSSAAPAKGRGAFGLGPLGSVKFAFTSESGAGPQGRDARNLTTPTRTQLCLADRAM